MLQAVAALPQPDWQGQSLMAAGSLVDLAAAVAALDLAEQTASTSAGPSQRKRRRAGPADDEIMQDLQVIQTAFVALGVPPGCMINLLRMPGQPSCCMTDS